MDVRLKISDLGESECIPGSAGRSFYFASPDCEENRKIFEQNHGFSQAPVAHFLDVQEAGIRKIPFEASLSKQFKRP
jgi:hypothetical protein